MSPAFPQSLPAEIVVTIAKCLDVDDLFNLALTSRHLGFLIQDDQVCRAVLESTANSIFEDITPGKSPLSKPYARALRRLAKMRRAIALVSPFSVTFVAVADLALYINGMLLYLDGLSLRMLDLHNSADEEAVVDIHSILNIAIDGTQLVCDTFQPLHYADGIVSCLCRFRTPLPEDWLLLFNPTTKWYKGIHLNSAFKLFVRNNKNHVLFGTHTGASEDNYRRWVIQAYDICNDKLFDPSMVLENLPGSDIGSTVCFEVFGDYFYALSNETTFGLDGFDWTSYYHCFRFPVCHPSPDKIEVLAEDMLWRRKHAEGPLDDRWTFLKLEPHENTKKLQIVESRKEWLGGRSSARRTYYTLETSFSETDRYVDEKAAAAPAAQQSGADQFRVLHGTSDAESAKTAFQKEGTSVSPQRSPHHVHPGDDGALIIMSTLSKTFIRSYHTTCSTFMDLIDEPSDEAPFTPRIRLRAGSRKLRPYTERKASENEGKGKQVEADLQVADSLIYPGKEIKRLYRESEVRIWPPEKLAGVGGPDVDKLHQVLVPPGFQGQVTNGMWDKRSLVYSISGADPSLKAIIFINFDPAIRLQGVQPWCDRDNSPHGSITEIPPPGDPLMKTSSYPGGKGKGKLSISVSRPATAATTTGAQNLEWVKFEKARYRDIQSGYDFSYLPVAS
ncbi:uncharacterized protein E0L32_006223 [Thyridium curvatum]|uniref:F-box domain-containing protein n=1 Tax=Thyridium curvatum TaxID=1093900 RepID=A0A507B9I2_9PEZI|nr:uncharacterized protein E0L32_006223 [Thyridium curvatum]TPX13250.1 hypothetical protein E0L32_006223 [Thyridium curvatum]